LNGLVVARLGPAAWLLAAGLSARALGQIGSVDAAATDGRLALAPTLLYCLGFGYALRGVVAATRPKQWMHVGTAALLVGSVLDGLGGLRVAGILLSLLGGALLAHGIAEAASRTGPRLQRLALLTAAAGPTLFALHAIIFAGAAVDLLPARFVRLAATAAMALPLLAVLYGCFRDGRAETRATRLARTLLGVGMVALPLVLVLSAFVDVRLKYALGPASDCFTVALIIACAQAWRERDGSMLAGFATVLGAMLLGKAMGFYGFDGPLPAPAALATYDATWRVALRHFHVDLMVLGYTLLLWPSLARPTVAATAIAALLLGLLAPGLGSWAAWVCLATMAWVVTFWRGRVAA
jgi:hypothetical protein